jgi:hypothetical protein
VVTTIGGYVAAAGGVLSVVTIDNHNRKADATQLSTVIGTAGGTF